MDLRVHAERIDRNTSTFNGNVSKSSHVIFIHFARRQMRKETTRAGKKVRFVQRFRRHCEFNSELSELSSEKNIDGQSERKSSMRRARNPKENDFIWEWRMDLVTISSCQEVSN